MAEQRSRAAPSIVFAAAWSRHGSVGDPVRIRVLGKDLGTIWEQPVASPKSVEIALRAAADAELSLQSSDGTPADRAFATAMNTRRGDPAPRLQAQFVSDARGRIRIPALPDAEIVTLVITADGAAPRTITGTAAELSRTVRLAAAAKVAGRFVDEDGEPIAGVRIEAEGWISGSRSGQRVSDDAGRWTSRVYHVRALWFGHRVTDEPRFARRSRSKTAMSISARFRFSLRRPSYSKCSIPSIARLHARS
jgi:hypothetical protein